MINNKKIKTSTKIIFPIILIATITAFISSSFIDPILQKYIKTSYVKSLNATSQKNYCIAKSSYKNLFFNYGDDLKKFEKLQKATKSETVENLKFAIKDSEYCCFIVENNKVIIPIKGSYEQFDEIKENNSKKYFISNVEFIPWNWKIVTFQNKIKYFELIKKNKLVVIVSIFGMAFLIIAILTIMLRLFLQNQIDTILKSLKEVARGKFKTISISNFYNSYEISQ